MRSRDRRRSIRKFDRYFWHSRSSSRFRRADNPDRVVIVDLRRDRGGDLIDLIRIDRKRSEVKSTRGAEEPFHLAGARFYGHLRRILVFRAEDQDWVRFEAIREVSQALDVNSFKRA